MKSHLPDRRSDHGGDGLLSARSALVFLLAILAAVGGAALLFVAHHSLALMALGAFAIFGAAVPFFDRMIDRDSERPE